MSHTPAQTIGPFFSHALRRFHPVPPQNQEHSIWVLGTVRDGAGDPVPDALIESWQDAEGFSAFGRCPTDAQGKWSLHTVKAPYLVLSVFARGLLHRLVTRVYFPDQTELNTTDPVLTALSEQQRRKLVAESTDDGYVFDIHLQGEHETVFFTW